MPGSPTLATLEVLGEVVFNAEHTFARTDQGYDGEQWIYYDSTLGVLRLQIYSLPDAAWTEIGGGGDQFLQTETITGNDTLDASNDLVLCNATGGAFTVTLPAAASNTGRGYHIKKIDASGNGVTVDGNASETIDDQLTVLLSLQYDAIHIVCDGSEWWIC